MERKNRFLILIIVLLVSMPAMASYKTDIYQSFVKGDMVKWKQIIDKIDKIDKLSNRMRLTLLNYQYGYVGYCIGADKDDEAEKYLDKAWENLKYLEGKGLYKSETYAYRSALYGFEIGLAPAKAPFIGGKSSSAAKKAKEINPKNYNAQLQLGNILFYSPAAFGGDKQEAIKHYLKALELMENNNALMNSNWNYLSVITRIGEAYEKVGDYQKAKKYYQKALAKEPNYKWVKEKLLPALEKKIKEK